MKTDDNSNKRILCSGNKDRHYDSEECRERLLEIMKEKSFERRKVRLSSGRESDFYIDCKSTVLLSEGHYLVGNVLLERIPDDAVAVGGLTLGADPIASAISYASWGRERPVDAFIVRKEAKGHGTGKWIESPGLSEGAPVVILEDVMTTGASTLRAIERVREAGYRPLKVIVLVDRMEGGREEVEKQGRIQVESIFNRLDFIPED